MKKKWHTVAKLIGVPLLGVLAVLGVIKATDAPVLNEALDAVLAAVELFE